MNIKARLSSFRWITAHSPYLTQNEWDFLKDNISRPNRILEYSGGNSTRFIGEVRNAPHSIEHDTKKTLFSSDYLENVTVQVVELNSTTWKILANYQFQRLHWDYQRVRCIWCCFDRRSSKDLLCKRNIIFNTWFVNNIRSWLEPKRYHKILD